MIKHHPTFELIQRYVHGDLPASIASAIKMHADMCPLCQEKILQLTEQIADANFEPEFDDRFATQSHNDIGYNPSNPSHENRCLTDSNVELAPDFEEMMADILSSDSIAPAIATAPQKTIKLKDTEYLLPAVLNNMELGNTAQIGKLARARVLLDEGEIHTSLLHIDAGGSVPEHTHKGFELTLLLDGSFSDHEGEYVKGDFIMLDHRHQHQPVTEHGCLCYTVVNDSLRFTQGINKLLNPIGNFIY